VIFLADGLKRFQFATVFGNSPVPFGTWKKPGRISGDFAPKPSQCKELSVFATVDFLLTAGELRQFPSSAKLYTNHGRP
jgi:hypothetical protein